MCVGCGRRVTTDAAGAWDLATPSATPRLDTDAGTVLWLTPNWEQPATWMPVVKAYVELSKPEDDCCLVLRAPLIPNVADDIERACDEFAGGIGYGDILLVDAARPRPTRAHPVDGHAAVVAALATG